MGIFADGVAVRVENTSRSRSRRDEVVRVTNDEICAAIKDVFDDTRSIMEPAGAGGRRPEEVDGREAAEGQTAAVLSGRT